MPPVAVKDVIDTPALAPSPTVTTPPDLPTELAPTGAPQASPGATGTPMTTPTGQAIAGNVGSLGPGVMATAGWSETAYRRLDGVSLLELRRNLGHQRAIAVGMAYVEANRPCRAVVLMDSDGEDDPRDIPRLLAQCHQEGDAKIIFAERTKRVEVRLPQQQCGAIHRMQIVGSPDTAGRELGRV